MRAGWTIGRGKGLFLVALIAVITIALGVLGTPAVSQSVKETPSASEIGVTPTEIHIAVVADVDNPIVPNVLAGARDAVFGFAKYVNSSCATKNKCLAGRKLVPDFYDSHLNPNETRNAEIQSCTNDFAMVGTSAVLMESVDEMRNCKDRAGFTTGIPDIPVVTAPLVQQCSDQSFPILPVGLHCDTKDQHPQTYDANVARAYYFTKKYGPLHGIYIFTSDSTTGYDDQLATFGRVRDLGIGSDHDFAVSGAAQQTDFTPIVQAMKAKNSNYAGCAQPYPCTVLLRKEAALQGVANQAKVWDCTVLCYDKKFLQTGGADVEHEYVDLPILPFYDPREQKTNPMLANFVTFTGKDKIDGYGADAWAAAVAFRDAVNATVKAHGLNGLTRANLFAALTQIHKFDAGGMIARTDLAARRPSDCHILTQVRNGTFVRVEPTKPGTFDCNTKYVITRKLDLRTSS
jgi:hypothetical protein